MEATMVEEEQRVFIAIDESTAHGTYNDRSFGLALSVCTSGWDYESDQTECVTTCSTGQHFKITAFAELNWMTYDLYIAYLNELFFVNTHSYKDAFD